MSLALEGKRSQEEAGWLLSPGVRQVRRIQRRPESKGDVAVVHGLRRKPSNRKLESSVRKKALAMYRDELAGFHPKQAWEKLTGSGLKLSARTLHLWLVAEGLRARVRKVEQHRRRRERKACFGAMVQADASEHDWLEGRGPGMELAGVTDSSPHHEDTTCCVHNMTATQLEVVIGNESCRVSSQCEWSGSGEV